MRRFALTVLSLSLMLGLAVAQDPKVEKKDAPKVEAPPADKKEAAKPAPEAALPSIPPEVEAKLEAARLAVAEAIVAAQDAGLVETTIDPPPVLDILVTGRAIDLRELKASPKKGVSPEVFAAWFTGYGGKNIEGVKAISDVWIVEPSKGLTAYYTQRSNLLNRHIDAVRKAKATTKTAAEETAKAADLAAKAKTEADAAAAAKIKADGEAAAKAKADAEAKAKADADAKAQQEAAAKAKADADTKAQQEAAAAKKKADDEAAAKAKADAEAKARADAEARKKAEDEAKAKADAEAKAKVAADAQKAADEAKAKADAEAKAKADAEAKAKAEADKPKDEPKA